jgi:hypothetical protein
MTGRTGKWALDEWFIWRWLCRVIVIVLVAYWLIGGSEPSERWIGLIALLLGVNEFRVNIDRKNNDKPSTTDLDETKRVPEQRHQSEGEPPSLFVDWGAVVT